MSNNAETVDVQIDFLISKISRYLKIGTLVSTIFTGIGGFIIITYMLQIKYIPEAGISDLTILFLTSSFTGFLLYYVLSVQPMMVTWVWCKAIEIESVNTYFETRNNSDKSRSVALWLGAIVLFYMMITFVIPYYFTLPKYSTLGVWIFTTLALVLVMIYLLKFSKKDSFLIAIFIVASCMLTALAISLWILFVGGSLSEYEDFESDIKVISLISLVVSIPVITIMIRQDYLIDQSNLIKSMAFYHIAPFVVTLLILSMTTTGPMKFTNHIVSNLGIGNIENVRIVFDVTGLDATEFFGSACMENQNFCTTENVDILWGRGDRYLLKVGKNEADDVAAESNTEKQQQGKKIIFPENRIILIEK